MVCWQKQEFFFQTEKAQPKSLHKLGLRQKTGGEERVEKKNWQNKLQQIDLNANKFSEIQERTHQCNRNKLES